MTSEESLNRFEMNQSTSYTESIYHFCYGFLLHHLHVKNKSKSFERTEAENEVEKIKPIYPVRLCLLFCKDRLRIKRFITHTNRYKRYTLFYKQIEVYYFTPHMKHLVILGIISPNGSKRGYQYIYIENKDDHFKIQTILNQIFENPLKILSNMPIVGQLIIDSFKNESIRSRRLGRLIIDSTCRPNSAIDKMQENEDFDPASEVVSRIDKIEMLM
ncbi:unnamed protein product [Schistosoma turkestanicum]|nr:unnamed protein product [Schistosoma turkestanicum]